MRRTVKSFQINDWTPSQWHCRQQSIRNNKANIGANLLLNHASGSIISRSSLQSPVKTTESVSSGLNLTSAEGTKSSSSRVMHFCPAEGKRGITRRLIATGCIRSNCKLGSFKAELTNWKLNRIIYQFEFSHTYINLSSTFH